MDESQRDNLYLDTVGEAPHYSEGESTQVERRVTREVERLHDLQSPELPCSSEGSSTHALPASTYLCPVPPTSATPAGTRNKQGEKAPKLQGQGSKRKAEGEEAPRKRRRPEPQQRRCMAISANLAKLQGQGGKRKAEGEEEPRKRRRPEPQKRRCMATSANPANLAKLQCQGSKRKAEGEETPRKRRRPEPQQSQCMANPTNLANPANRANLPNLANLANPANQANLPNSANLPNLSNPGNQANLPNLSNPGNQANLANLPNWANQGNPANPPYLANPGNQANLPNLPNWANQGNPANPPYLANPPILALNITIPVPPLRQWIPEYILKYTKVVSVEQRERYADDFMAALEEFESIHTRIARNLQHFNYRAEQLRFMVPGSEQFQNLYALVQRELLNVELHQPGYSHAYKRYFYLECMLIHVSRLVHEFDSSCDQSDV